MKKATSDLLQFLAGILMLVSGLFIFSQKVVVSSTLFYTGLTFGGIHFSNGIIMIPFIAGIIWMFVSGGKLPSIIMTGVGVLIIILSIILSTSIHLTRMTLFDWIVILILIFGGAGFLVKILIIGPAAERRVLEEKEKENGKRK